jgi:hypothetical protein
MHLPLFLAGIGGDAILSMLGSRSKEPHGSVRDGKCAATPVGNRNPIGSGSTTIGARKSTVIAGKSGLACGLADENAASVRTAPSEADIAVEMWRSGFTSYNTARRAIPLKEFHGFS